MRSFLSFLAAIALSTTLCLAQDSVEQKFNKFDRDGDGKISAAELDNPQLMQVIDSNGDGFVTRNEAGLPPRRADDRESKSTAKPEIRHQPLTKPLRDLDPVVMTGADLPSLIGKNPGEIVAFAFRDGWRQIPVQIDQRVTADLVKIVGEGEGRLRRVGGRAVHALVYADAATRTGADSDPMFDKDDELVVMFKDASDQAAGNNPNGVVAGSRVEVKIADPVSDEKRFVYLFISDGSLKPDAGRHDVRYALQRVTGTPKPNGPRFEDSIVETSRYRLHFVDRWMHDGTWITAGDATGVNILDGDKFQFAPGNVGRTTETFSRGGGGFVANIEGPLRAIRSVMGCNSGTYAQRDHVCYEGQMVIRTYLRVHPIPGTWLYYDFSPAAKGMTYYDNLNLQGATIDGKPDDMKTGLLEWQFVTGKQGSLTIAWDLDTDVPNFDRHSHYFDDDQPNWKQGVGDEVALAASGAASGKLPNTDPVYEPFAFRFNMTRTIYYDPPETSLEQAKERVTAAWFPLKVEISSEKK